MQNFYLAHILPATTSSVTYGTPASALIFALVFTAIILIGYLFVDKLPKPAKNKITSKAEPKFIKAMIVLAIGAMLATSWDVWWHLAVGRDSFWEPPHMFLYSFAAAGTFVAFYAWWYSRDFHWKHRFFTMLLVPIAGAFDNFWHTIFGSENLSNPKLLPWSPPHVLLELAAIVILVHLLVGLIKYRRTEDFSFFGNLCLGGLSALLLGLVIPFHPTEGWGQVAGFAGAGMLAFVFIGMSLTAQKVMKGRIDATFSTMFMLMIFLMSYGKEIAPKIIVLPHDRPPVWLFAFSYLVVAILLDITKNHFSIWLRGFLAGVLWAGILFGFSSQFFAVQFQYGIYEIFTAVTFAGLGGLVAASLFSITHLFDEAHIEKLLRKW